MFASPSGPPLSIAPSFYPSYYNVNPTVPYPSHFSSIPSHSGPIVPPTSLGMFEMS